MQITRVRTVTLSEEVTVVTLVQSTSGFGRMKMEFQGTKIDTKMVLDGISEMLLDTKDLEALKSTQKLIEDIVSKIKSRVKELKKQRKK